MNSITIFPKNEKQEFLLKTLFKEMKVKYETEEESDSSLFTEKDYYSKIDKSIKQARNGQTIVVSEDKQKELLGL